VVNALILGLLLPLHCDLSISFTSGESQHCSAQVISSGKILTASHCLNTKLQSNPKKIPVNDRMIIATCGSTLGDERTFYIDEFSELNIPFPEYAGDANRDQAFLHFENGAAIDSEAISFPKVTRYPALYFEADGALKKTAHCFAINRSGNAIELGSIIIEGKPAFIPMRLKKSNLGERPLIESELGSIPLSSRSLHVLVEGDSGSPLYCCSNANAEYELIGVTSTILRLKDLSSVPAGALLGNRFTPLW
jgi:hypothetical protein